MAPTPRHTKVEQAGNVKIISFTGSRIRDLENMLAGELDGHTDDVGDCHLLLDFSNVGYIGSLELGTLIALHKRITAGGGRLTLFNLSANVFEVFTVTRLQTLLEICREGPAAGMARHGPGHDTLRLGGAERTAPARDGDGEA